MTFCSSVTRSSRLLAMATGMASTALLLANPQPAEAARACVTFEPPLAAGTVYGGPVNQTPGTLVLFSNSLLGSIENFQSPAGPAFGLARIEMPPSVFAAGQALRLNNISMRFHSLALPFRPIRFTFKYLDLGGSENLGVNGGVPFMGNIAAAPAAIGGFGVSVSSMAVPGGRRGSVTVSGNGLRDITIGGQEFWIDEVCASN